MNLDQLRIWANDLRLSSGSSDQDDILRNEIIQEDENVDENVTNEFSTDKVFNSRQSLIDWIQNIGRNLGYIIVIKRSETSIIGKSPRLLFQCNRGGTNRGKKTSTNVRSTKKINCPFRVKGVKMRTCDNWMIRVVCGTHNHAPASHMERHS